MDDYGDHTPRPSIRTVAAIVGLIGLLSVVALTFMGGQVTSILSNVGNSISVPNGGAQVDAGSDATADGAGA